MKQIIDEGKFKLKNFYHSWSDTLSDDDEKIIFLETTVKISSFYRKNILRKP